MYAHYFLMLVVLFYLRTLQITDQQLIDGSARI